ncbi:aspartate-semialdehyde dehydrogenase, partial [SAR202 cluster bacterium AD-804-J14_MRT_500m]|nr:aspartate-semialdehyde dehydrogenase [SAR202 cluster bacterium AD-804-J14_MRT_500m]
LDILDDHPFPINNLKLLASQRSAGTKLTVRGQEIEVGEAKPDCFDDVDLVFISASSSISQQLGPEAVNRGALVIDDSSAFRMQPNVPLVVPEVNGSDVEWHQGIISIPNCSTTPLVMAIHPLVQSNAIRRVIVNTYQSVSGAGGAAIHELREQSIALANNREYPPEALPQQIAFNLFPQIGDFLPSGYTDEEEKMINETRKILHQENLGVSATCVRVPVYVCHSESVHLEFENPIHIDEVRDLLSQMPGLVVCDIDDPEIYPMPGELAGTDDVYIGRIRQDRALPNGIAMWLVSDNLRKGAALNAIQIAEEVIKRDSLAVRAT